MSLLLCSTFCHRLLSVAPLLPTATGPQSRSLVHPPCPGLRSCRRGTLLPQLARLGGLGGLLLFCWAQQRRLAPKPLLGTAGSLTQMGDLQLPSKCTGGWGVGGMFFYPSCQLSHLQKYKSGWRVKMKFPCYPEESRGNWAMVVGNGLFILRNPSLY